MRQSTTVIALVVAALCMPGAVAAATASAASTASSASSASSASEALQAIGPRGAWVLTQAAGRLEVTQPQHAPARLQLPESAYISAFAATRDGWLAAGVANGAPGESGAPGETGSHLILYAGGEPRSPAPRSNAPRALGAPRHGSTVHDPVLLATPATGLSALAWIENNGIRVSQRTAAGWSEPREIANFAAGMTLALAGSVTDAGSFLLWSAFDGEDDEIFWSRRDEEGAWSDPARIAKNNAVPDITPAVRAIPGGALAAWSRFDGAEYEVVVSRFDGASWGVPLRIAGAALRPSFPASAEGASPPLLLYRTARPRGWAVVALPGAEHATPLSASTEDRADRPLVLLADGRAQLRWLDAQP